MLLTIYNKLLNIFNTYYLIILMKRTQYNAFPTFSSNVSRQNTNEDEKLSRSEIYKINLIKYLRKGI